MIENTKHKPYQVSIKRGDCHPASCKSVNHKYIFTKKQKTQHNQLASSMRSQFTACSYTISGIAIASDLGSEK